MCCICLAVTDLWKISPSVGHRAFPGFSLASSTWWNTQACRHSHSGMNGCVPVCRAHMLGYQQSICHAWTVISLWPRAHALIQFSPCKCTVSTWSHGAQGQYQSLLVVVLHVMSCTCATQIWPYVTDAPAGGTYTVSCIFRRPFLQLMQTSLVRLRLHNTQTLSVQRHMNVVGFKHACILQSQHCMAFCAPTPGITRRKPTLQIFGAISVSSANRMTREHVPGFASRYLFARILIVHSYHINAK